MTDPQKFEDAIQAYWNSRLTQSTSSNASGAVNPGQRSAVTGGAHFNALESLIEEIVVDAGLTAFDIRRGTKLEIPGYFRAEKKWDLLVLSQHKLVCAIEIKSQAGPSFGNNFNNRAEESIGIAVDVHTAFREGMFGASIPFVGFIFVLEDCPAVHKPVAVKEPHFKVDPEFVDASYAKRYEILFRRMVLERHFDSICLALSANAKSAKVKFPAPDLNFDQFEKGIRAAVMRVV